MDTQEIKDVPRFGVNDPPIDWSREEAVFERVRARLFRDHPGQFVIISGDEVVGPFPTYEDAIPVGYNRFGRGRFICCDITEKDEPVFIPYVVNHPSVERLD